MRLRLFASIAVCAACAVLGFQNPAAAQSRSSSGAFGQRTLGGNLSPSNSGFGGQGSSGSFNGQSLGGGSGFGSGSGSGFGSGNSGLSGSSDVGQISGNERFIRGARQGQFVGGDSGDTAFVGAQSGAANGANRGLSQMGGLGGASQYGRGGTGGLGGMFGSQMGRNQFGMNNLNQMGQNGKRKQLRVPVRLGFEMPVTTASQNQVTTQFAARLPKFPGIQLTGPVDVSMEGKTVVLKGSVASERDRDLAERLALLEPGIASVRNELQVNPSAPPELELLPTPAAVVTPPVDD